MQPPTIKTDITELHRLHFATKIFWYWSYLFCFEETVICVHRVREVM